MISLIIMLVILGLCLHLLFRYVPMEPAIKTVIMVVVILCIVLYLVQMFGIADFPLPHRVR